MRAFVAGATGETGRRIVKQLTDRGIEVRAFVRDAEKARGILPEGVEIITGDVLRADSLKTALNGCTVVFCATGAKPSIDPTQPYLVDFEGTKNLVNAAKAAGVEQFVLVTSLCVSKLLHPLNLFWGILVWKKWAEEYLQRSGLSYTIVRPGGLKNDDNDDRIVMKGVDSLFDGSIPRTKVAQVCVEACFDEKARNKILEVVASAEAEEKGFAELFAAIA
jgi:uncharacterized protein YbjT (DUF2867 family)